MARAVSAAPIIGAVPIFDAVAGLTMSKVAPESASDQRPSI
jgi:hypothetical protein